ncbi:MAG: UDP-2,3-diacylglucosamine diphosphatase [Planctomycetota bacterium]|jgi:UDP-2,3-diacylglucosamine hydrolase
MTRHGDARPRANRPRTIIFSDVHLSEAEPEKTEALVRFLACVEEARVDRLVCLGDLFHAWVGPGHETLPSVQGVLDRLAAIGRSGTELIFVHGNRDFLVDDSIHERVPGLTIVRDHARFEHAGRRVLITHGDLLCARDTRYRAMRRVVRARPLVRMFNRLPLKRRLRVAGGMRSMSEREVKRKSVRTLSLSRPAVRRLLRRSDLVVAGHVHHAERIAVRVGEDDVRPLFTLGAWDHGNASWLELDAREVRLFDGPEGRSVLVESLPQPARRRS